MRMRMNNPYYLESAELRSEYGWHWTELAEEQARMWRIKNGIRKATPNLQTSAQLTRVKEEQDEFVRKLAKLDDQRRLDLLRELQDTSVKLNQIREKLQSVGEKLQYTAMARSQFVRGARSKPDIAIIRKGQKGPERIIA